jgi:putative membrane protein
MPNDIGPPASDRFVIGLAVPYALWWAILAIDPVDRSDWLLENLLVALAVPALVWIHRKTPLTRLSYSLCAFFLALHAVGSHYTYSEVPLGDWLKESLDLSRNHFDRVAHAAFGLLLFRPLRELLVHVVGLRGFASYYFPASALVAWSGIYEIVESWVAVLVAEDLGTRFLGSQGDEWDAQKDMTCALVGALVALAVDRVFDRHERA